MKLITVILTILLLLPSTLAVSEIKVTAETIFTDPYPAEPGKNLTIGS